MHGTDVVTIDGDKIGHVVDERDEYLIVEHGLLKTKHAVPRRFVEQDAEGGVLRTTLSKSLVHDSPKVNGEFDRETVAEHYGLAEGFEDPPTRGAGVLDPDDAAYTEERSLQERIRTREEVAAGEGLNDGPQSSPGATGGDRARDYPKDPPKA